VSARARARVAATKGDHKIGPVWTSVRATVRADLHRWWLFTARPPSLQAWSRTQRVTVGRVPGDSALLRRLWVADNWSTGVVLRALATALQLLGAGLAWLAQSPARRWFALLIVSLFATAWWLS
jgi:hypothetical protein